MRLVTLVIDDEGDTLIERLITLVIVADRVIDGDPVVDRDLVTVTVAL